MKSRSRQTAAYLVVIGAIGLHVVLFALQNLGAVPFWLAELSRFLPFYWLLIPLSAALVFSFFLRPVFVAAALLNVLLFGLFTMDFHWKFLEDHDLAGTHVRVLTYNIKALNARAKEDGFADIEREVQQYAPDIVALQDAQKWLTDNDAGKPATVRPVFGLPYVLAFDQYVLASRFPLQNCSTAKLDLREKPAHYLQCEVRIQSKTVQLVTTHLVSPRSSLVATKTELWSGLYDWQMNLGERIVQARALLTGLSKMPRPLIVMGDLNAPEQSPVVATVKLAGLRDAFAEAGRGWGYTHGHALSKHIDIYRIDHILLSADIVVQHAEVGSSEASEHNPVIADLLIQP